MAFTAGFLTGAFVLAGAAYAFLHLRLFANEEQPDAGYSPGES